MLLWYHESQSFVVLGCALLHDSGALFAVAPQFLCFGHILSHQGEMTATNADSKLSRVESMLFFSDSAWGEICRARKRKRRIKSLRLTTMKRRIKRMKKVFQKCLLRLEEVFLKAPLSEMPNCDAKASSTRQRWQHCNLIALCRCRIQLCFSSQRKQSHLQMFLFSIFDVHVFSFLLSHSKEKYSWTQTLSALEVFVHVPPGRYKSTLFRVNDTNRL